MSPQGVGNGAILEARPSVNGIISPQDARLIDNGSVDTFGGHDYGYGASPSPADMLDNDGWLGDGKNTFRMVNTERNGSVHEEVSGCQDKHRVML